MSDNKTFFHKAEQGKLGFGDIFSDVFRRHTKEENARLFLAGTPLTTPDEASMLAKWLKPYLFARIFLAGIILIIVSMCMANALLLPFIFMVGSFLVPVVGMILFWEMNIPRNISFMTVLLIFVVGGILSLVFTTAISMFYVADSAAALYISVGIGEEIAKILAVIVFLRKRDTKYILTGMLVGAAVGAGFSALESAGYNIIKGEWSFGLLLLRAVYAMGGHVSWAAITAGALVWVKGSEKLSAKHLTNPVFLGALLFAAGTHAIWDLYLSAGTVTVVQLGFNLMIVWVAYMIMKKGVNQVVEISLRANGDRLTFALDHDFLGQVSGGAQVQRRLGAGVSVPGVSARRAPASGAPAPGTPFSGVSAPGAPVPGVPVPGASVPSVPAPGAPVPLTPGAGSDAASGGLRLQCLAGAFAGHRFALTERVRIGRDPSRNDLVFPAGTAGVSGAHCELLLQGGQLGIRDLGSSYGTYVNGSRLSPNQVCQLRPGDHVYIGSKHQEFQITLKGGKV